ncbi:hypothetical protein C8J56DRAFT_786217 [Mycena floridula]|nr:hypothetical protein C8J56DRAFT_786217 [Mycena floridula]
MHEYHGHHQNEQVVIVYTSDAATKITARVRRRCFNCSVADTATWRRSTLSQGKVLCNKCGLFERTHHRPRPHQFSQQRRTSVSSRSSPYQRAMDSRVLPPLPSYPNPPLNDNRAPKPETFNSLPRLDSWKHEIREQGTAQQSAAADN